MPQHTDVGQEFVKVVGFLFAIVRFKTNLN